MKKVENIQEESVKDIIKEEEERKTHIPHPETIKKNSSEEQKGVPMHKPVIRKKNQDR